jgi:hypothetical protein
MIVNDELERIWKEVSVVKSDIRQGLGKLTKSSIRVVGAPATIRTRHLPNISPKRYRLSQLSR